MMGETETGETLKTRVKLNTNFARPHAITYTNCTPLDLPITLQ